MSDTPSQRAAKARWREKNRERIRAQRASEAGRAAQRIRSVKSKSKASDLLTDGYIRGLLRAHGKKIETPPALIAATRDRIMARRQKPPMSDKDRKEAKERKAADAHQRWLKYKANRTADDIARDNLYSRQQYARQLKSRRLAERGRYYRDLDAMRNKSRLQAERQRRSLSDGYVKRHIVKRLGISARSVPQELVEANRLHLELIRKIKQEKLR